MVPGGFARDHRSDDVADCKRLAAVGFGFALGGDGVGGFAGLRDQQRDGVRRDDGIAITPLAGVVHFDGDAGQAFDHELAGLSGMPTGAAGGDVDLFGGAEFGLGDLHLVEEDLTGVLRNAAERGVADGAGLLVDFLEHEVLEAALFRHDRVPGDVLDLAVDRVAVEVGELHAALGDDGEVAVGEEKEVARVIQDGGHVGGDEVFLFAESDDGGRPIARGDDLVRFVDGDDGEREDAGKFLYRFADGFFKIGTVSVVRF